MVLGPFLVLFGCELTLFEILHLMLLEYLPSIILLLALFTVAGGIHFAGSFQGTPRSNTAFLAGGTLIASWTGTTGASMPLIPPVMRAKGTVGIKSTSSSSSCSWSVTSVVR